MSYYIFLLCISHFAFADVQISGLQDYTFTPALATPFTDQNLAASFCVYRSGGAFSSRVYQATISGLHDADNTYYLSNGNYELKYHIDWSDSLMGSYTTMMPGQAVDFSNASTSQPCVLNNTRMRVRVLAVDLAAAKAGAYSDQLSLLISEP